MTSYHSGLIKIYLPLSPPPSFPCWWQINTKLNKHVLCQLMSNTNLTALDKHKHTHTFKSLQFLHNFSVIRGCMCIYTYHKYEDMFQHKKFRIIYFFKIAWVRITNHIPTCLCENKLGTTCKPFFFSQLYWSAIYI